MNINVYIHAGCSVLSFLIAFMIFWKQKGTITHKILGWVFWVSMIIAIFSSFFIYQGFWSVIHILSIIVTFWLIRAIYAVKIKPKNWRYIHASSMGATYIAIIIAGSGVIMRKIILVNNHTAGYITSVIVAIPCVYFLNKLTFKYYEN